MRGASAILKVVVVGSLSLALLEVLSLGNWSPLPLLRGVPDSNYVSSSSFHVFSLMNLLEGAEGKAKQSGDDVGLGEKVVRILKLQASDSHIMNSSILFNHALTPEEDRCYVTLQGKSPLHTLKIMEDMCGFSNNRVETHGVMCLGAPVCFRRKTPVSDFTQKLEGYHMLI